MTAICGGGASQQIPGTSDTVLLTSAVIASILGPAGLGWLEPFVGYLAGVITLNLPAFCAIDPPADPGVTATDLLQLVALGPGPLTQGATDRITQLVQRYAWYHFCQCSIVDTPAPPTAPAAPSGAPVINPPQVGGGSSSACQTWTVHSDGGPTPQVTANPLNNFDTNIFTNFTPLPVGATVLQFVTDVVYTSAAVTSAIFTVYFFDATGVAGQVQVGDLVTWDLSGGGSDTRQIAVPPGAFYLEFQLEYGASIPDVDTDQISIAVTAYCGGVPGSVQSGCCPPDPIATAKLDSIFQLVTLLQRQLAPFAYVSGPVHSALSGIGTIDVAGIVGLLLNTSVPDRAGRVDGAPVTVFDVGWIALATDDGYTERFFLSSDSQVIFPRVASIFTHVGYSIASDTTCTITELVREP